MKILGTLFRLLCALIVLLAVAVYLDGPLQVSLVDYIAAFTPEHLQSLANPEGWPVIAAGALLLLTLCCGLKLGWNIAYSLATLAFFAEVAVLTLGPELALPTATRGLGWEPLLRELALNYPVPALLIPSLCILGCLCSSAPVRIAWTSLLSCALCYGCAELLHWGVQQWQAMPEPVLPRALELIGDFPWALAALPALFFVQYSIFMAMFETIIPRRKKKSASTAQKEEEPAKAEDKPVQDEAPAEATKLPAAPVAVAAAPVAKVVVKRPVVPKKAEPTPAAVEKPAEEKPEETPDEEAKDAPAPEEPKPEGPKAEEPRTETPAEEPKAEEVKLEAPAAAEAPAATETESTPAPAEKAE